MSFSRACLRLEILEPRALLSFFGQALFPADSPWNQRVANAPVATNSAALVSSIGLNSTVHADFGAALWQGGLIGIPVNVVTGAQPKVSVVLDAYADESDAVPIPIPDNALIEGDPRPSGQNTGDRHLLVYDRDNNILYETFNTHRPSETPDGRWHADSQAVWDLNRNSFRTPGWTSADAAGLPILPGLVRADEVLDQGRIDHAIRFTVPRSRNAYVYPASHHAGSINANLPRMGERFRLKQSFDVSSFSHANRIILQALKDYGLIVADNGSPWYVSGEPSPRWNDTDLHNLGRLKGSDFEAVDLTPVVTGLDKTRGPGGGTLLVSGLNFSGGAGQTRVFFGSVAAANVTVLSATQIRVTVPAHAAGTVHLTVRSPYGTSASGAGDQFTFGEQNGPTPHERFVTQLYADLLRRTPDGVGLTAWTAWLDQGGNREQVAAAVTGSTEYRTLRVQDLYRQHLGRDAETAGLNSWLQFLGQGGTLDQLRSLILGSDEYFANGGGTQGFLETLYQDVLGRGLDAVGGQGWRQALDQGVSRAVVAQLVAGSTEALTREVSGVYSQLLRRGADTGGLSGFVAVRQRGLAREWVEGVVVGSEEYFGRL